MRKLMLLLIVIPCITSAASAVQGFSAAPNVSAVSVASAASGGSSVSSPSLVSAVSSTPAASAASAPHVASETASIWVPKSPADTAAWFQAIGTFVAIAGAAGIAIWQAKRAAVQALRQLENQKILENEAKLDAFVEILEFAVTVQRNLTEQRFISRKAIADARNDDSFMPEVRVLELALSRIELHLLPPGLIGGTLVVAATFTRLRLRLENVLQNSHKMDEVAYAQFFIDMDKMFKDVDSMRITLKIFMDRRHLPSSVIQRRLNRK